MNPKPLTTTGIKLPEIGIGTWMYRGGPELLRRAVDLGANLIDTAEYYENEEVVGQAIKGIRDRVIVATKTNHWKHDDVLRSAEESLRKLGIDCIDLYQLHWPNGAVPMDETFGALEKLVDQGKVRYLGISNFSVGEMKKAQAVLNKAVIVSNQMKYSLIERTIEPRILPYCQEKQMTVLAYSPLGHDFGKLLKADPTNVMKALAVKRGKTVAQIALNWCVSKPGVVAIPKTESVKHLEENCGASGWRLEETELEALDKGIKFRRRGVVEGFCRRVVRNTLQRLRR